MPHTNSLTIVPSRLGGAEEAKVSIEEIGGATRYDFTELAPNTLLCLANLIFLYRTGTPSNQVR